MVKLTLFLYLLYLCPCLSSPRSIYVVSIWSIFYFHLHFHHDLSFKLTNFIFLEYVLLFLDDNEDEECE